MQLLCDDPAASLSPYLEAASSSMPTLGGSWVVISRVTSRITVVITYIRGLITLLVTTHEPPSTPANRLREVLVSFGCKMDRGTRVSNLDVLR